jgi:DNA polymerase-3 subunit alpha
VLAPDIQKSRFEFTVTADGSILYGLGAIKGIGESAIENLIEERQKHPFRYLQDLSQRIDPKKVNKRTLESLIKSGALDCFGLNRGLLMAQCDGAMRYASQFHQAAALGQNDLFSDQPMDAPVEETLLSQSQMWAKEAILQGEKETLGMYFSGHPLDALEAELSQMHVVGYRTLAGKSFRRDQTVLLGGFVTALKTLVTKNGDRMAIVTLDDKSDRFEITVFSDLYQRCREWLVNNELLIVKAAIVVDPSSQTKKIRAQSLWNLDAAREAFAKKLRIQWSYDTMSFELIEKLKAYLASQLRGACQIEIEYHHHSIKSIIKIDGAWDIQPSLDILNTIRHITQGKVDLAY